MISGFDLPSDGVAVQILTDNGKVFTGGFGPGTGEVLFDRIFRENVSLWFGLRRWSRGTGSRGSPRTRARR